jgi:hypothetical protein
MRSLDEPTKTYGPFRHFLISFNSPESNKLHFNKMGGLKALLECASLGDEDIQIAVLGALRNYGETSMHVNFVMNYELLMQIFIL